MICFILLVIALIGSIFLAKTCDYDLDVIGILLGALCALFILISIIVIIVSHALVPKTIRENTIKYESLCKRLEIINSDYEDVSKSDVIADIAEWNSFVYNTKYWTYNPWTNWYNPKEIADNLDYISIEQE